jgi:PadR family transcriptional regulator, regulatory protein PadR
MAGNDLLGTLGFLILETLSQTAPLHGYGIIVRVQQASDELFLVEEGSLYPALHGMELKRVDQPGMGTHRDQEQGEVFQADGLRKKGVAESRRES